jgi:hypothetical protein
MKRRAGTSVSAVALVLLTLTSGSASAAAAAAAGDGRWTATACHGEAPYNGAWLGTPGLGASYTSVFADHDVPLQWITWNGKGQSYVQLLEETHAHYASAGYECGRFGLPYKEGLYQSPLVTYRWTFFVKPGRCDMRYIIHVYEDGPTFDGVAPSYFCLR